MYLAIDQGSHATRALAIDVNGHVVEQAFVDIGTTHPDSDRVEHDALELGNSVRTACGDLFNQLGHDCARLLSAGLATQRSSIVCWDRSSGVPLSPVISWRDRRAADRIEGLAEHADLVSRVTGLVLSPHYGASKIRWCLDHLAPVREAATEERLTIGPLSSFLTRTLCASKRSTVDPANASRTLLWDRRQRRFSKRLCALFGIDPGILPRCVPSAFEFGRISVGDVGLPLRVVTGDQSAALFAFGEPDPDTAYVNIGTGAFFQRRAGGQPRQVPGLLNSVVWDDGGHAQYVVEGTVNGAASALDYLARRHDTDARSLVDRAVAGSNGGAQIPLFMNGVGGLAAPFWLAGFDSEFIGAGSAEEQALAVLESIAFLLTVNLQQCEAELGKTKKLLVTGGLSRVDYLCQCLADACATRVTRTHEEEATCLGLTFLTAKRPSGWPVARTEREFTPQRGSPSARRFAPWRQAMASRGAVAP